MPVDIVNAETEQQPIREFAEQAYLDYSMYVILDRALPSLADGLKPVQRRIIYAMSELGLSAAAKYKKSARTVGDVLGKFHPHGDAACYEAMVLMAQDFSYRYPFVDGQGNWGSSDDPKSFAAMRYTESRLTPFAQCLLSELEQGTVEWQSNFDGTLQEPTLLPARLPNVLLNGASGIAVGMATDIPPHNVSEMVAACLHLLDHPKATLNDLMKWVPAPDYPSAVEIITPKADFVTMYETGHGSVRLRAKYEVEAGDIVINAVPYQVSGSKVLEQIAQQMLAKKLPAVSDLRDESDHETPTRLVITPRSNRVDIEELMSHLFATTDLERTYRVNMNVIDLEGRPQVKGLVGMLTDWLTYRTDTVRRRLQFELDHIIERLHLLDGLLVAYLNLDEVIHIIRTEDDPKAVLMKKFKLSEEQTTAILNIRLRQLAKLEEIKIRDEQVVLSTRRDELEKILGSSSRLKTLVKQELKQDGAKFGDARRCQLVDRTEAKALSVEQRMPSEAVTLILSEKGFIRVGKGHEVDGASLSCRSGDAFLAQAQGKSNQSVTLLDSQGRSYALSVHGLPSTRGHGEPLTSKLRPAPGSCFVGLLMGDEDQLICLASDAGYGFLTRLKELQTKNRNGKAMLKCPENSLALAPMWVNDLANELLVAVSNEGRLLAFPLSELPELSKGKGNKILSIPSKRVVAREEFCVAMAVLSRADTLRIVSGKRHLNLKPKELANFIGERGRRGALLPRGFRHVDGLQSVSS